MLLAHDVQLLRRPLQESQKDFCVVSKSVGNLFDKTAFGLRTRRSPVRGDRRRSGLGAPAPGTLDARSPHAIAVRVSCRPLRLRELSCGDLHATQYKHGRRRQRQRGGALGPPPPSSSHLRRSFAGAKLQSCTNSFTFCRRCGWGISRRACPVIRLA